MEIPTPHKVDFLTICRKRVWPDIVVLFAAIVMCVLDYMWDPPRFSCLGLFAVGIFSAYSLFFIHELGHGFAARAMKQSVEWLMFGSPREGSYLPLGHLFGFEIRLGVGLGGFAKFVTDEADFTAQESRVIGSAGHLTVYAVLLVGLVVWLVAGQTLMYRVHGIDVMLRLIGGLFFIMPALELFVQDPNTDAKVVLRGGVVPE